MKFRMPRTDLKTRAALALALAAIAIALVPRVGAQEATAGLSSPTTFVGQPVEIVVTVRDSRSAEPPERVDLPGLPIQLFGRQTRFEMNNFKITSSLTFTYLATPERAGEFDIPPFEVRVDNRTLRTNPLRLTVSEGAFQPPPPQPAPGMPQLPAPPQPQGQPQAGGGVPYFGELVLSKRKAYTGEVVPAELRYYFNSTIGGEVGDRPSFSGEGFTVQKFANIPKREQIVNGENYVVFSFQTAITPAKSGTLEIPAARLEARLQLPGSAPAGFEDFFRNFGGMPPGMFTNSREVAIETRPATLEVVPLPKEGKPDDFTGAIGKFQMEASVSPKKAGPGDPVTLRVTISGQGNFEAMGAPVLTEDGGWKSYPPTEKFDPSDPVNFGGSKAYEFTLVAREDRDKTPGVRFSFLDPDTGKYELLSQAPFDVVARAGQAPQEPVQGGDAQAKTASPTPTPAATAKTEPAAQAGGARSWVPLLLSPSFLLANAIVAVVWVCGLVAVLLRRASHSPAGLRRARRKSLQQKLSALASAADSDFYSQAAGCLHTALDTESNPLEATAAIDESATDPETKEALRELLQLEAESKYSASGRRPPDAASRQRILAALKKIP